MGSSIGGVSAKQVSLALWDIHNEKANKIFLVGPGVTNTQIQALIDNTMLLSNLRASKGNVSTASAVTGLPTTAIDAQYDPVSMGVVLMFSQISPYNPNVTLFKSYTILGPIAALLQSDKVSIIVPDAAAAAGTPAKILSDLVNSLEVTLTTYIKANNQFIVGGWTYQPSLSKLDSFLRELDGNTGT